MATPEQVLAFASQEAQRLNVPVDLVRNTLMAESGGRTDLVSSKGAIGPMQLMPTTAKDLGVDPNNWKQNVTGGVQYLGQMLNRFGGDATLASAAYNAGPRNVEKHGGVPPFKETQNYVQKVVGGQMDYDKLMQNSTPVGQQADKQQGMTYEDLMKSSTPISAQSQQAAPKAASSFALDLARGARDPIDALAQLLPRGLEFVSSAGGAAPNPVSKFFGSEAKRVDEINRQAEAEYRQAGGDTMNAGRFAGNVATSLVPGAYISRGAQLAYPTSRAVQTAIAGGAASGLLTPVERPEDFATEKAFQTGYGAIGGPLVDKVLGGVVYPLVSESARKLQDIGVKLTPGQAFGGGMQAFEDALAKLPLVGSTARASQERSMDQFRTGVINSALSDVGKSLPANMKGRDAIKYMSDTISQEYDKVLPKVQIAPTLDIYQRLGNVLSNTKGSMNNELQSRLETLINDKITTPLSKGTISGFDFKRLDSDLGKKIVTHGIKGGDDGIYADALKDVQTALRDNMRAINPNDAQLVENANSAWSKKLRIEGAAGYMGAKEGAFTPSHLVSAAKGLEPSKRKSGFAQGESVMQNIAEAGESAMMPSSSMKQNLSAGVLGSGGLAAGYFDPATASLLAGTAMTGYSVPMQAAFRKIYTSARPDSAAAIRGLLPSLVAPPVVGGVMREEEIPRIELRGMANR